MIGRECSRLDPCYQRHITFACTGCYISTTHPSPSRHYYPQLIAGTNLPTQKRWIAWWARAKCMNVTVAQGYYTLLNPKVRERNDPRLSGPTLTQSGRKWTQAVGPNTNSIGKEMNPGRRARHQLNINEPTAPYVRAREINLNVPDDRGSRTTDPLHQQPVIQSLSYRGSWMGNKMNEWMNEWMKRRTKEQGSEQMMEQTKDRTTNEWKKTRMNQSAVHGQTNEKTTRKWTNEERINETTKKIPTPTVLRTLDKRTNWARNAGINLITMLTREI